MTLKPGRAAPLPPEERRAALVDATLGLLAEHGAEVTTRQIATAAGVAEGTIFRVFDDKDSLVNAAVHKAFAADETAAAIRAVDPSLPLDERLAHGVALQQQRVQRLFHLLHALRYGMPARVGDARSPDRNAADEQLLDAMETLVGPDADQLARPPREVVQLVRMLLFSATHPVICGGEPMSPAEIVSVVLDGVRRPTARSDRSRCPDPQRTESRT